MGYKSGGRPAATQSFLHRICHALDETPRTLAANLGVSYNDIKHLLKGSASELVEIDREETWWLISQYVSRRIGYMLAIREEMNRKLQKDRANMIMRQQRFKAYHDGKK